MKKQLLTAILSLFWTLSASAEKITTHTLIMQALSKRHGGAEIMELIKGDSDFVGFDLGASKRDALIKSLANNGSALEFAYLGGADNVEFTKDQHFSEEKVRSVVKKLKKKCERYVRKFNENNEYSCSDIFVYTGDVSDPHHVGNWHSARGQKNFEFMDGEAGNASSSKTRSALLSNNEHLGNYEVYVIGIVRN